MEATFEGTESKRDPKRSMRLAMRDPLTMRDPHTEDPLMPAGESGQPESKTECGDDSEQARPVRRVPRRLWCGAAAFCICVCITILGTGAGVVAIWVYVIRKWTSDEDSPDAVTFAPDNFTESMQ